MYGLTIFGHKWVDSPFHVFTSNWFIQTAVQNIENTMGIFSTPES